MNRPWPELRVERIERTAQASPLPQGLAGLEDTPGATAKRFLTAACAVLTVCALAYPVIPRRYEASAAVVLQPTDLDGQADRTLRQPLDENALQSEVDLITAPALADRVIEANGLRGDPEFNGAGPRWSGCRRGSPPRQRPARTRSCGGSSRSIFRPRGTASPTPFASGTGPRTPPRRRR